MDEEIKSTSMTLITEYMTVTISVNKIDLSIDDLYSDVIEPLLLAAGYSKEVIDGYFDE